MVTQPWLNNCKKQLCTRWHPWVNNCQIYATHLLSNPVNMPDPIWKRLVMASYSQRAARIGLDSIHAGSNFLHPFQLCFFKKGMDHFCAKPTQIPAGWPGQDLENTSGLEASRCAGIIEPGFWQDATGLLPVSVFFRLGSILPQVSWIMLCKTSPDPI